MSVENLEEFLDEEFGVVSRLTSDVYETGFGWRIRHDGLGSEFR